MCHGIYFTFELSFQYFNYKLKRDLTTLESTVGRLQYWSLKISVQAKNTKRVLTPNVDIDVNLVMICSRP